MTDEPTAAVRYKEIVGRADQAADELREWENTRADELNTLITAATAQVAAATEREQATTERASRWWRMAEDSVARLSWLEIGLSPEPVPSARADWLDHYVEEMRAAYQKLSRAILNLSWLAR